MKTRDEILAYWRDPERKNQPDQYIVGRRSQLVLDLVSKVASHDSTILELGCNVGRNLHHLHLLGYQWLFGIEMNREALLLMRSTFPRLSISGTFLLGTIEDRLVDLAPVDIIFTMAVLEHIHPDSDWIFPIIADHTKHALITIEDEMSSGVRHEPRDYFKIFEGLGLRQIHSQNCGDVPEMSEKYIARVFVKDRDDESSN